jgi:acetyl-CoA carboxylase biotin carboxyl carrier protein
MEGTGLTKPLSNLTDDEVRQIALLVETVERSTFDYLQLELGDLKVTIGKGGFAPPGNDAAPGAAALLPPAPAPVAGIAPPAAPANAPKAAPAAQDGTVTVVAPMIGRFYAKPEPGAAPFVSVGTEVTPDSTVALIEVMKVFTAVRAGVQGVVTEICVQDEQLVEYGQVLIRVRPLEEHSSSGTKPARKDSKAR